MKYVLGLDLGIASVGWSVINLDCNRIESLGVRAFDAAEEPKTGASLAEPRRMARSVRRRLRRRRGRLDRIQRLFEDKGFVSSEDWNDLFILDSESPSPWQLRAKGLDRLLSGGEFARALYHIAKHRGFKSNRKGAEKADKEAGLVLQYTGDNKKMLLDSSNSYRTAGEMICKDETFQERKRNTTGDYTKSIDRDTNVEEIHALFDAQRRFGSPLAASEIEKDYLDYCLWQRPFSQGDDVLEKVGACTFEPSEKRAAKKAYTTERFILLDKINHLTWLDSQGKQSPNPEQKKLMENLAYQKCELKYSDLRKYLKLDDDARFLALTYQHRADSKSKKGTAASENGQSIASPGLVESLECETTAKFCQMSGYKELKSIAQRANVWDELKDNHDLLDEAAFALTFFKTDDDIQDHLRKKELPEAFVQKAVESKGFSKVSNLSLLAMKKIIPFLEEGFVYSEACEKAGYNHSQPSQGALKLDKLPVIDPDEVRNPVVLRTLTQARKVVNALIRRFGAPYQVNIELAREMGRSREKRKELSDKIDENRLKNRSYDGEFKENFNRDPNGEERLKWRLYREQGGKCAYSLAPIDLENRFFEPGYVEIDHILPYSRSFDDSISNKVLVLSRENQNKRNQTPFEYFGANDRKWNDFEAWANATIHDHRKRVKLLIQDYKRQERDDWMPRNLIDTQYIARYFSGFIRTNLKFADDTLKLPVVCVSGAITSMLRGVWGLAKDREKDDLHHALDATVIAAVNPRTIRLLTEFRKARETAPWSGESEFVNPDTGEIIKFDRAFPQPWKGFRKELLARLSENPEVAIDALKLPSYADNPPKLAPVFISRMPHRKMSGAIHKETIKGIQYDDEGIRYATQYVPLTSLTSSQLDELAADESDKFLVCEIRKRMKEFGNDAKKAFSEPLYKLKRNGENGPRVRRVKIIEKQPSGVPDIRYGIADNASMIRVDIFTKGGKFFIVPLYTKDIYAGIMPNKAITAYKPESEWPDMDESYLFLFSLYPYDLVKLINKKEEYFGYYRGTNRALGSIAISDPNNNLKIKDNIGAKTALKIEKYEVNLFGEFHLVREEKRRGLENCSHLESGEAED